MRRHDRLAQLGACHGHHRYHGLATLDAYRSTRISQLAQLSPRFRGTIRDLVETGHRDVLLALFPAPDLTWLVAGLTYDRTVRHLSVSRGLHAGCSTELLSVRYDVRDAEAERRAWRALLKALGGSGPPS